MMQEVADAEERAARLEAALRRFGAHSYGCLGGKSFQPDIYKNEWYRFPCSCGLDAALESAGRDEGEASR